jgi:hypothetical protein
MLVEKIDLKSLFAKLAEMRDELRVEVQRLLEVR